MTRSARACGTPLPTLVLLLLAVVLGPSPLLAEYEMEDLDQVELVPPGPSDWSFVVGAGVARSADYSGASTYHTAAIPVVEVAWRNRLRVSTLSGIRYNFVTGSAWQAGALVRPMTGRPDEGALEDIEEVSSGFGGGGYVSWNTGQVTLRAEVLSALTGDISGSEVIASATWRKRYGQSWMASLGPSAIWRSGSRMQDLYGLSPEDADILGVSEFSPSSEFSSLRLSGNLTYLFNRNWSATFVAVGTLLVGDAADSPVVDDLGDEFYGNLAVTINYQF